MSVRYVDTITDASFSSLITEYFVPIAIPGNLQPGYNPVTGLNTKIEFHTEPPISSLAPWYGPIWYWDTSQVTDMSGAFKDFNLSGLFSPQCFDPRRDNCSNAPITGRGSALFWNTSKVKNMESMFENFQLIPVVFSGPISFNQNFVTTSIVPGEENYLYNKYIKDDYDIWDVSKVENMKNMFKNSTMTPINSGEPFAPSWGAGLIMSNWNTSKVTTMESMFEGCSAGWGDGTNPQKDCLPQKIIRKNGSNSYYNSWVTYKCKNFKKMFANISLTNVAPNEFPADQQSFLLKKQDKIPIKGGWMIEDKINTNLTDMFKDSPKLITLFEIPIISSGAPEYWQFNYVDPIDPITTSIKDRIEDYYTTAISSTATPGAPGLIGFQPNEGINTKPEYSDITHSTYYGQIWDWDTSQVSDFANAFQGAFTNAYNYYDFNSPAWEDESKKWYFGTGPKQQADNNITQTNYFNKPIWIDKWDTSSATNMNYMFNYLDEQGSSKKMIFSSSSLESKYVNDNDPNTTGVLYRPPYIAWNTSSVATMVYTFRFVPYTFISPKNLPNVRNWNTSSVTDMTGMYSENGYGAFGSPSVQKKLGLKSLDLSKKHINNIKTATHYVAWDTSSVTNMSELFYQSHKIPSQSSNLKFNIGNWDTSSVTNMSKLFNTNKDFNEDISEWDTSSVTTMESMFKEASTFEQYISKWDTSSVTTMESMFKKAYKFNSILDDWDTSSVTTMESMFEYANTFNHPLHKWDVSGVITMESMFESAKNFKQDIRMWTVSTTILNITNDMFKNCKLAIAPDAWNLYNGSPPGKTPSPTTYFNRDLTTKFYYPQFSMYDAVNPVTTFLLPNIYLSPRNIPPVVDNYKILDTKTDTRTLKAIVDSGTGVITLTGYDDAYTNESSASIIIKMETTSGSVTSIETFEVVIYDIPLESNDFPFPIEQKNKRCLGVNQKLAPGLARPTFNFSLGKFNPARFRSSNTKSKFKNVPIIVFKNQI